MIIDQIKIVQLVTRLDGPTQTSYIVQILGDLSERTKYLNMDDDMEPILNFTRIIDKLLHSLVKSGQVSGTDRVRLRGVLSRARVAIVGKAEFGRGMEVLGPVFDGSFEALE